MPEVPLCMFDSFAEIIVVAKNKIVIYINDAARKIFGSESKAENAISDLPEADEEKTVACMLEYEDKMLGTAVSMYEKMMVYVMTPPRDMRVQDQLLVKVGAAIREPLTVLRMASGLMRPYIDNTDEEKIKKYNAAMTHSSFLVSRIVNNMCFAGRIEDICNPEEKKTFDLLQLCGDIADTVTNLISDFGLTVTFETMIDDAMISGWPEKIENMLLNILSNNIKFTEPGGKIVLSLSKTKSDAIISITDTGRGIPKEKMASIFQRYKVESDGYSEKEGIGLGLCAVQKVAMMHGGNAIIESRKDIGTKVIVRLPLAKISDDVFRMPSTEYSSGGMSHVLTGLADVLKSDVYTAEYLD